MSNSTKPDLLARLLVRLYIFMHGRIKVRGSGALIRLLTPFSSGLCAYPLTVPQVGTAMLDFNDIAAFGLLNASLGEVTDHRYLFPLLESCLAPGSVLWDVGANVGVVSAHFAHPRFRLAGLHAFEPNPRPLRSLQSLFRDLCHVRVHPIALGAHDENRSMSFPSGNSLVGSLAKIPHPETSDLVEIRSGDSLCAENEGWSPDVVKIDVEGFEPAVIQGLQQTIQRRRPVIFLEHIWLKDNELRSICPRDYKLLFISDSGLLHDRFERRADGHDAWLLPAERSEVLVGAAKQKGVLLLHS